MFVVDSDIAAIQSPACGRRCCKLLPEEFRRAHQDLHAGHGCRFALLFGCGHGAPKTYCEELKGTDTGQACQIQMSDPAYNINISLPSYYPDQKSLENYIAQTRDKFLSAATSSTPREAPYELNITSATYQSAIPPRGTQAVVLKVYQNAGGTHPTTTYKAFDWDQAYRKPITYDTLWQADTDPLPVVFPIVQGELSKQTGQQVSIAPNAAWTR